MKSRIPRAYYFIPAVYLVLIGFLLHLHLGGGEETLTKKVGPLRVEAHISGGVSRSYESLEVSFYGFTVDLSGGIPVGRKKSAETGSSESDTGGGNNSIAVTSIETMENGIRIVAENGARLDFRLGHGIGAGVFRFPDSYSSSSGEGELDDETEKSDSENADFGKKGGSGVRVRWTPPENKPKTAVALTVAHEYEVNRVREGLPLFSVGEAADAGESSGAEAATGKEEGTRSLSFLCTFTGDPNIDESGRLHFSISNSALPEGVQSGSFIIEPYEGEDPLMYWFFGEAQGGTGVVQGDSGDSQAGTVDSYQKHYERWRDKAYAGWQARYLPDERTWRGGGEGLTEFEAILSAYAAESMRRDSETGLERFSGAMDAFGGRHSFTSSPYLGNILGNDADYSETEEEKASDLRSAMEETSRSIFSDYDHLLRFLLWYGDEELIGRFNAYVEKLDVESFEDPESLVEFFCLTVEAVERFPSRFPAMVEKLDALYGRILQEIVRFGGKPLYLTGEKETGENEMDGFFALRLGKALLDYSSLEKEGTKGEEDARLAEQLGAELAGMVLREADEDGFLPSSFVLQEGEPSAGPAALAPEKVYPYITENRFYPRFVSLKQELGSDVRLWTVARGVGATREGNSVSITLDFAVGETEYVVIRGVPAFDSFRFYGARWGADRRFQTYGVGGWYYEDQRNTLYAKLRHQRKVERIEMLGVD